MMTQQQVSRETDNQSLKGERIVAGTDGSPASIAALEWAARQAEFTGASLEVVAPWEWPTSYGWSFLPDGYDPSGDLEKMLGLVLDKLRDAHPGVVMQSKVVEGSSSARSH